MKGFVTRRAVIQGVHVQGKDAKVSEIMRTDIPTVKPETRLHEVQKLMQQHQTQAMPVERHGHIVGIVKCFGRREHRSFGIQPAQLVAFENFLPGGFKE